MTRPARATVLSHQTRLARHKHSPALTERALRPSRMLVEHSQGMQRAHEQYISCTISASPSFLSPVSMFRGQDSFPSEEPRHWIEATDYSFALLLPDKGSMQCASGLQHQQHAKGLLAAASIPNRTSRRISSQRVTKYSRHFSNHSPPNHA